MTASQPLLSVKDLRVRYGPALALDDVSIEISAGQALAVLGPNGAGKSTLARAVSGLVPGQAGTVHFDGKAVPEVPVYAGVELVQGDRINGPAIIGELIRNMELGQFELNYSVLLPCIFSLYLHPEDYARLAGVLELIIDDAKRTLCARVTQLNAKPRLLGLRRPGTGPAVA